MNELSTNLTKFPTRYSGNYVEYNILEVTFVGKNKYWLGSITSIWFTKSEFITKIFLVSLRRAWGIIYFASFSIYLQQGNIYTSHIESVSQGGMRIKYSSIALGHFNYYRQKISYVSRCILQWPELAPPPLY